MATTTFTAALLHGPYPVLPGRLRAEIDLGTFPSSWTAAGVALDLSAAALGGFTVITDYRFVNGDAITDFGYKFDLFGTDHANGDGITASTVKVAAHWGAAGTAGVYPAVDDSTDLSGITCMKLIVEGY